MPQQRPSGQQPKATETHVPVVYRGPHGRFIAGTCDMTAHGRPVQMPRDLLAELRETFPEHRFEEVR